MPDAFYRYAITKKKFFCNDDTEKNNCFGIFVSTMNPVNDLKKDYLKDWRFSRAKTILRQMIEEGKVTKNDSASNVYTMCEKFQNYKFESFKANLKNLIESYEKTMSRVRRDEEALRRDLDLGLFRRPASTKDGKPIWVGSAAEKFLVEDIKNGIHLQKKPQDLRKTREAYMVFDQETFRKRIHQTKTQSIGKSYWMRKKQKHKTRSK